MYPIHPPRSRLNRYTFRSRLFMSTAPIYKFLQCLYPRTLVEFRFITRIKDMKHEDRVVHMFYERMEFFIMAQKFAWTFVEIKLLAGDKPKVLAWAEKNVTNPLEVIDDITELGYKVSISYIDDRNSYVVSVSGSDRTPQNNKQTITTWSSNLEECLIMAGYKILHLTKDGKWEDYATESSDWG